MSSTQAPVAPEEDVHVEFHHENPWVTIVFNDPVNLMSYVTYVFRSYFGYSQTKAHRLMMEVHNDGKSVVATGTREQMERDTAALHGFGLWATCQRADA